MSIDRDGDVRQYVFGTTEPEGDLVVVWYPEQFDIDLEDYAPQVRLHGPPQEATVMTKAARLVRKLALGQEISLPVILDER